MLVSLSLTSISIFINYLLKSRRRYIREPPAPPRPSATVLLPLPPWLWLTNAAVQSPPPLKTGLSSPLGSIHSTLGAPPDNDGTELSRHPSPLIRDQHQSPV
ncbi:hypothetical protein MRS44_000888 [Fusarium solani]|uniref:uncharacterized protein n=1 Tax=Fusarium solani TaxID=169388 RepID=UPI0032C4B20B|nr:hypothetical protein MRS44_000888 [Fusarium solani]